MVVLMGTQRLVRLLLATPGPGCGLALFGAQSVFAETTMNERKLEDLELRYLEWRVEYGEDLPAGINKHPWRSMSASVMHGRLNLSLAEGAPSLVWYGTPGIRELDRIKALATRLLREHGAAWSGRLDRQGFDSLEKKETKRLCTWKLIAVYTEPGGRDTVREIRFQGADKGDNAARLAFEIPFAAHVESLIRRLHASAPKTPTGLLYSVRDEAGTWLYALDTDEEGLVRVSRMNRDSNEESEVDPALLGQVTALLRKHKVDAWHGLAAPGWTRKTPDTFDFSLHYDTGQDVWIHGWRQSADPAARPAGFPDFERELLAALDEALDGPAGAKPFNAVQVAASQSGLKRLDFSQSGSSYASHITYRIYTRREAGRDLFRVLKRVGDRITECGLTDTDMADLEALLTRHRVADWNGFHGNAKDVLDGDSFSFSLEYADGRRVSAGGYMRFPKGYCEVREALTAFLDQVLTRSGARTAEARR